MKNVCPSCGSSLPETATVCSNCGEDFVAAPLVVEQPIDQPSGLHNEPTTLPPPTPSDGTLRYCSACGAANPVSANFCSSCGSALAGSPARGLAQASSSPRMPLRNWLYAVTATVLLALLIYVVSTPEEGKGPPTTESSASEQGVPPGHPDVGGGTEQMTPEQKRQAEEMQKRLMEQSKSLRSALDANPANDSLRLQLANVYYDLGEFREALPLYREYLKNHPNEPDVQTDLAFVMANLEDVDGAIVVLTKVIEDNPRHITSAYNLALMYVAKRNTDSTTLWLKRVIAIDSTSPQGVKAAQILEALSSAHEGGGMPNARPLPDSGK